MFRGEFKSPTPPIWCQIPALLGASTSQMPWVCLGDVDFFHLIDTLVSWIMCGKSISFSTLHPDNLSTLQKKQKEHF